MNDEYLKGFDPLENKENITFENKMDTYFDWFTNECTDQYEELYWLIDSAMNPSKKTPEDIKDAINQVYNHMNEK